MKGLLPWVSALVILAGCSKSPDASHEPASPAATQPAAATPASAASKEPEQVPAELVSRLTRPDSPVLGPADAPVTIVEVLDPACEACRGFAPVVKQIQFLYPKEVRVVVRFAEFHDGSEDAIRILLAAHRQGKLDPVLAALFDGQDIWASHQSPNVDAAWKLAAAAGLDMARARKDAASPEFDARLRQEAEDLMALKVAQTPTFYVNGKLLTDFGPQPLMSLVGAEVKATAPGKAGAQ
jgi:protein-disulfide isomerase